MSIREEGIQAERKARMWLRKHKIFNMQQPDWFFKCGNYYYIVEVKARELFKPPPFLGTGLDIRQINLRNQIFDDLGIPTILLVFEKNTDTVYYQYLNKLEKTNYFDTRNNIRIYNIKNFKKKKTEPQ